MCIYVHVEWATHHRNFQHLSGPESPKENCALHRRSQKDDGNSKFSDAVEDDMHDRTVIAVHRQ